MDTLEARYICYEAVVNAALPVVDFYLTNLSKRNATALQQTFGNQMIDIDQLPDDLRVVPPADLTRRIDSFNGAVSGQAAVGTSGSATGGNTPKSVATIGSAVPANS